MRLPLRVRVALHVLRGRPTIYRVAATITLGDNPDLLIAGFSGVDKLRDNR